MAYNLEFLVQILEQFLHPDDHDQPLWILDPKKKPQIESLLQKARFLKDLLETSSSAVTGDRLQSVESRIRDVAYEAEDVLESHLVDQLLSSQEGQSFTSFPPDLDLEEVIEDFDYAKEEMMAIVQGREMHPKYRLMGPPPNLVVFAIVGVGGIGKTTLARNLYDDPSVISRFKIRAWVTISQDYNVREILLSLLHCVTGKLTRELLEKENEELGLFLWKHLERRRYLIVLDDVWDIRPWDDLRKYFWNHKVRSRIIVTTRYQYVADYMGSRFVHQIHFLKDDESWELLKHKVFSPQKPCPPQLESVGRKIAKYCGGLPIAIQVISGILSQADRTEVFWEQVAEDLSLTEADDGEQILNVLSLSYNCEQTLNLLSLSYNYLPYHLKPCLLYMSAFPEDYEIHASKLIKLWVAEGFLKPILGKSLEEAAEIYLKDLVDRNLIIIQQRPQGNVKSYRIHDLLRDFCVRKAYEENFQFIKERYIPGDVRSRRVCAHGIQDIDRSLNQMPLTRSFLSIGDVSQEMLSPLISAFRLLRVLDILGIKLDQFPGEILQLVNLRYLALSTSELPSSISRLWNLQILIVQAIAFSSCLHVVMPEILDMTQLRHIKFKGIYVWYDDKYREHFVVQDQLQSLSTIAVSGLTDRVLQTIPNLGKLGIFFDEELDHVKDLSRLHKLHTLNCRSPKYHTDNLLSNLIFSCSLKKLSLHDCGIRDPDMSRIADDICFPRLEHLVIRHCSHLNEIPRGIGDIPTLKVIEMHECNPSVVDSARKIQEEQESYGNEGLEVRFGTL
ncbi:UNVERIFIED_CONTAM: Disease resistance protein RPP13 [Sesamum radiatum]|uniref:Disease resistance protein RPP13 n=1 Tax=Sesamum radiatum TaxID=300843 RepID=A0AAW2RZJ4_SESRA